MNEIVNSHGKSQVGVFRVCFRGDLGYVLGGVSGSMCPRSKKTQSKTPQSIHPKLPPNNCFGGELLRW